MRASLRNLAATLGLARCLYVHIGHSFRSHLSEGALPARFLSTNAREEDEQGLGAGFMRSSLIDRVRGAFEPFLHRCGAVEGDDVPGEGAGAGKSGKSAAEPHAMLIVPVQDYIAGPAFLAFGPTDDWVGGLFEERSAALVFAAAQFHAAVKRFSPLSERGHGAILTSREIECLRLAALGWTVVESGRSLGIAGRTVEFHLRNAAAKLGAPNKLRAVALAVSGGLIDF